jgi:hypothetical protein
MPGNQALSHRVSDGVVVHGDDTNFNPLGSCGIAEILSR